MLLPPCEIEWSWSVAFRHAKIESATIEAAEYTCHDQQRWMWKQAAELLLPFDLRPSARSGPRCIDSSRARRCCTSCTHQRQAGDSIVAVLSVSIDLIEETPVPDFGELLPVGRRMLASLVPVLIAKDSRIAMEPVLIQLLVRSAPESIDALELVVDCFRTEVDLSSNG